MQQLKFLLAGRGDLIPRQILLKRTLAGIIKKHFNVVVLPDDIRVSHDTIYLTASPALKNALRINHTAITTELSALFPETATKKFV